MSVVAALIDKARERGTYRTDSAIATHFGIHRQAVSKWRNGDAFPEEDHIVALAEMAGENPEQWLVAIRAVRGHGPAAKVWQGLARKLAASTALVLILALPSLPALAATPDQAMSTADEGSAELYIMRSYGCFRGVVIAAASSWLSAPILRSRTSHRVSLGTALLSALRTH